MKVVRAKAKGVSAVIALILVLMMTMGITGVSWAYVSGWFKSKTTVVLTITEAECTSVGVNVWVRNDGMETADSVNVDVVDAANSCSIGTIIETAIENCTAGTSSPGTGYHKIRVSTIGAGATGTVYCPV